MPKIRNPLKIMKEKRQNNLCYAIGCTTFFRNLRKEVLVNIFISLEDYRRRAEFTMKQLITFGIF